MPAPKQPPEAIAGDVMALAEALRGRVFNAMHDDDGSLTDCDPAEIIARAIMAAKAAEAERIAKLADLHDFRPLAKLIRAGA